MGGCGKHRGPVGGRLRPRGEFTFCLLGDPQQSHCSAGLLLETVWQIHLAFLLLGPMVKTAGAVSMQGGSRATLSVGNSLRAKTPVFCPGLPQCHHFLSQRLVSTGLRQLGFLVSEKDRFSISIGMQMPKVFLTVQLMGVNHRDSQTLIIFQLFLLFSADWVCAHRRHWCSCIVIDYDSGFMSSCSNAGVNWGNDMQLKCDFLEGKVMAFIYEMT